MNTKHELSIRNIIDEKLYPEGKFPRSLFPDIISVLTDLYIKSEKEKSRGKDEENSPQTPYLEEMILEVVGLKSLLEKNPGTIALIYKDLIFKFIFKRHINKDEVEEIVQEILTRFLQDKINGIRRRFNFDDPELPTFTSYFMVTVRNIYIDIIRKESRGKNLVENDMEIEKLSDNKRGDVLNNLILEEEFKKFNALLKLYHKSGPKLNLALKIKYNIPVDDTDILSCFPDCSEYEKGLFLKNGGYYSKNRKSIERIAPVFNKHEGKSNNPDTLRKWISTKIEEIKRQMNYVHPQSPYNNSSISDLIILYFKWEKKQGV